MGSDDGEEYSKWGRMMALYAVSLMFLWHIWRFLLHIIKFNRLFAFLAISSVCLLNESLLSRTTPRYLSDCMSSRCMTAAAGGSVIKISAAALCISVGTAMVE